MVQVWYLNLERASICNRGKQLEQVSGLEAINNGTWTRDKQVPGLQADSLAA